MRNKAGRPYVAGLNNIDAENMHRRSKFYTAKAWRAMKKRRKAAQASRRRNRR